MNSFINVLSAVTTAVEENVGGAISSELGIFIGICSALLGVLSIIMIKLIWGGIKERQQKHAKVNIEK